MTPTRIHRIHRIQAIHAIRLASTYRWPLFLGGLLGLSIVAQGVMVYFATRPAAPRAERAYYERSLAWDADQATRAASDQLGWRVEIGVPAGPEYLPGTKRPIDLEIRDRDGQPVSELVGELVAARPSDGRLSGRGALTEMPHTPGTYRALVSLGAPGLWELSVDARRGRLRYVHTERVSVAVTGWGDEGR